MFFSINRVWRFLAHTSTAALVLLAIAAPAAAEPRTEDAVIETSCGDPGSDLRVLVVYSTIHGSTAEIAAFIGEALCAAGMRCDVRLARTVDDIDGYDAVVIGSAIYQFSWLKSARDFVADHQGELAALPAAYFIVGASMQADTPEARDKARKAFIDPLLEEFPEITPAAIGLFGGAIDFKTKQYTLFERIVLRILGLILGFRSSADWRDWKAIDTWCTELAGIITQQDKPQYQPTAS